MPDHTLRYLAHPLLLTLRFIQPASSLPLLPRRHQRSTRTDSNRRSQCIGQRTERRLARHSRPPAKPSHGNRNSTTLAPLSPVGGTVIRRSWRRRVACWCMVVWMRSGGTWMTSGHSTRPLLPGTTYASHPSNDSRLQPLPVPPIPYSRPLVHSCIGDHSPQHSDYSVMHYHPHSSLQISPLSST